MNTGPTPQGTINIREVAPRDGLQIEQPVSTEAKIRFLDLIVASGVTRVETTAFVSPRAVPAMADADEVAAYVSDLRVRFPDVLFSALVANVRGAQRALASGLVDLEYVVSAAGSHSRANAGCSTEEATDRIDEIVRAAHAAGGSCEVIVATAWDCPFDGPTDPARVLQIVQRAVDAGVDRLCLGDTIGTTVPGRVESLVAAVRDVADDVPLGVHMHNTRGTGIASAWAAVLAGVTMVDASAGGLGGCPFAPGASGNIATEELVYLAEGSGYSTGVDLDAAMRTAAYAEEIVGHPVGSQLLRAGGPPRALTPPPEV